MGESADPEIVREIVKIVNSNPNVSNAHQPLTMHFGPDEILVNMSVEFQPSTASDVIVDSITQFESAIREKFPQIRRIFIEVGSFSYSGGTH
jgi:divalent metal cation (Fe/Co/Zn/Cd) transporter